MTIIELIELLQAELTKNGNLPVYLSTTEGEIEPEVEITMRVRTVKNGYQIIAFPAYKRLLIHKKEE